MSLQITPSWDPTGTVSVALDCDRRELTVSSQGQEVRFLLCDESPERLGWHEQRPGWEGPPRRVAVSEVVCHCLAEWEVEERVLELSREAAASAGERGACWRQAAKRLRGQCATGRGRRLSTLPFQTWWAYLTDPARGEGERLDESTAALRAGFRMGDGRADTTRLLRRLGLVERTERGGRRERGRTVNPATGLALCRALDRDPVELGL